MSGCWARPAFEIPRSVERDSSFDHLEQETGCVAASPPRTGTTSSPSCGACSRGGSSSSSSVLLGHGAGTCTPPWVRRRSCWNSCSPCVRPRLLDAGRTDRRGIQARCRRCTARIYEPAMWRHERYWKVPSTVYFAAFAGTPFINMILRLLGVRIGRRVFNDGCGMPERSLVTDR